MSTTTRTFALALAAALAVSLAATSPAHAKRRGRSFSTDKEFGVGLMVGAPSGLSAKYYLDPPIALAFGLGSSHYGHHDHWRGRYHNHGIHLHADVLWHPVVLTTQPAFQLPLYIGVGAQFVDHEYNDRGDGHTHIGARVPFGIAMDFTNIPLDIFFELAFALDFGHSGHTYIAGSLGARYYF